MIKVKLVETDPFTSEVCTVCGFRIPASHGFIGEVGSPAISVCAACLQSGEIDQRLEAHAVELLKRAEWLKSLVGRLDVPTYAEWQARMTAEEKRWEAHWQRSDPWPQAGPVSTHLTLL